nr:MAG TPA: hypothetical protein [Caudoviricetes sp.]
MFSQGSPENIIVSSFTFLTVITILDIYLHVISSFQALTVSATQIA